MSDSTANKDEFGGTSAALEQDWEQHRQLAEYDQLLVRLKRWVQDAPKWEPFEEASALFRRIEPELQDIRLRLQSVLVVGLVGGSGTGKSSLINALIGERVVEAGVARRPTTTQPEAICAPDVDLSALQFDKLGVQVHRRKLPLLENMILIDCPDTDTQPEEGADSANRNRDILRAIIPQCDVIINVVSQEKYKTASVVNELLRHAVGRRVIFVQTRSKTGDADIRKDWGPVLQEIGFKAADKLYWIDNKEALEAKSHGESPGKDFEQLENLLRDELANRTRHRIKRANAMELLKSLHKNMLGDVSQVTPFLNKLEEEVDKERNVLLEKIRTTLETRLQRDRHLRRGKLLGQLQERWGGGLFAGFLGLTGKISSWLGWAAIFQSRTMAQLVFRGGFGVVAAGKKKLQQRKEFRVASQEDREWGITTHDVVKGRSKLEEYAFSAKIDSLLELRTSAERKQEAEDAMVIVAVQMHNTAEAAVEAAARHRVQRRAGSICHWICEILFLVLPLFVVTQLARNFFYEQPFLGRELLGLNYLGLAAVWILLTGFLIRGGLIWWVSVGMECEVKASAKSALDEAQFVHLADDMRTVIDSLQAHIKLLRRFKGQIDKLENRLGVLEKRGIGRVSVR